MNYTCRLFLSKFRQARTPIKYVNVFPDPALEVIRMLLLRLENELSNCF